jgi:CDP-paratose 2-epimerase
MRFLITGGAGFIGSNVTRALLAEGHSVTIFDNLSRPGSDHNLAWLRSQFGDSLTLIKGDIRDSQALTNAVTSDIEAIIHLAGQVAVTTSVHNPREDFEINALGTFNLLEAARQSPKPPIVLYSSTNKVYGGMEDVPLTEEPTRYRYSNLIGISESQPLDFHSPYGCSKGTGDQYVRDYARIYGLRTVVFRQSCIYGPRQFGVEDQGWLAHFIIAIQLGRPINIYGDGKQVRDMLYIDDLANAYKLAIAQIDKASGQVYNIGGGPENALSIWAEVGPILEELAGRPIQVTHGAWRPGDQPVCIMDISKAERELGWKPQVAVRDGIQRLWNWVAEHRALFEDRA